MNCRPHRVQVLTDTGQSSITSSIIDESDDGLGIKIYVFV